MFRMPYAVVTGLAIALCGIAPCFAEEKKPESTTPQTLEECQARLEKTLGQYRESNHIEWRFADHIERTSKDDASAKELLLISDGINTLGYPFRIGQAVCFDSIEMWQGETHDVDGDTRKLTRQSRSHKVTRYSLTMLSGKWLVNAVDLSNGHHDAVGQPTFTGFVKWTSEGFEMIGSYGPGDYYATDNKYVLGAAYGSKSYSRDGDHLVHKLALRTYKLAVDQDGNTTTFPDFNQPFGSPINITQRSASSSIAPLKGDQ